MGIAAIRASLMEQNLTKSKTMESQESLAIGRMMIFKDVRREAYLTSLQTKWKNYKAGYLEKFDLSEFDKEMDIDPVVLFKGCACGKTDELTIVCPGKYIDIEKTRAELDNIGFFSFVQRNKEDLQVQCSKCLNNEIQG
jgi:hypothetical protein